VEEKERERERERKRKAVGKEKIVLKYF